MYVCICMCVYVYMQQDAILKHNPMCLPVDVHPCAVMAWKVLPTDPVSTGRGTERLGGRRGILFLKRSETDINVQSGCYDTVFCNHKYVCKFVIRMKTHYNCKHDEGTSTPEPRYKTRLPGPQVTPPGAGQKCSSRDYATPGIRTAPSQHAQVVPVHISVREAPLGS